MSILIKSKASTGSTTMSTATAIGNALARTSGWMKRCLFGDKMVTYASKGKNDTTCRTCAGYLILGGESLWQRMSTSISAGISTESSIIVVANPTMH
jgi:hypothetical protein